MNLNEKASNRLAQLGYVGQGALKFWQGLWDSEGESFFWGFLRQEEEAVKKYRRWFPMLKEFATECRQKSPIPTVSEFSPMELEQYRILKSKMEAFAASEDRQMVFDRKPNQAAILTTTRPGLLAADELFRDSGAVLLLETEKEFWFSSVYSAKPESFWWYAFAWWSVREQLADDEERDLRQDYSVPAEIRIWIVTSGIQWGSLAGGARSDAWGWNGQNAVFIGDYCVDTY